MIQEKIIKILNKIIQWSLVVLAGLIPLFFLPFTSEFYEFNKNILLLVVSGLCLAVWALKMVLEKKVTFRRTPLDLPILTIAGAFILSTIIAAPNKLETLWLPNGTGTIVALTILYFIMTNNIKKTGQIKLLGALIFGGVVLSLITIYQFIGLGESLIASGSLWAFLRLKAWTPVGGLLPLATFLIVILVLVTTQFLTHLKRRSFSLSTIYYLLSIILILAGLIISLYQLFNPANKPLLLPLSTAWAIAVESFKNGKIFLFGVGPKSFLDAFSQFRPLSYNLTPLWAIRFGNSSNFYLHSLTTVGLLGLAAYLWLIGKVLKKRGPLAYFIPLLAILLIFLFFPANFLMLFVFYVLLALLANDLPVREYTEQSRILPWTIFIPTLLLVAGCFFFIGRAYAAEIYSKHSLNSIAQNDGTNAYNHQIKAISLNPYHDVYRISYSQTNLLLADALARKSDISDQDRQNITVLIQQSISEAKTAVSLNKNKVINWENLANIYRQLINFAEGADQWTISTLRQTINLDPTNPELKLSLGGVYYALGNYDEAIRWFQQAVDNKVNFANGYYNLSAAYKEKGDFKKAHEMMQITLNLIPTDSQDYQKARDELEELAKKLPTEATSPSTIQPSEEMSTEVPLIEPETLPSPVITPPIELPEEQSAPEISPAPSTTN
ncbi:tetratricopeptide repeat protein [Patescibacteria group bacterium]|nr:tetratricopeptide repeat protein [Patescibacteria group bacterium]